MAKTYLRYNIQTSIERGVSLLCQIIPNQPHAAAAGVVVVAAAELARQPVAGMDSRGC